ncbi:hypothetical protein H5410_006210 [Solanum commersonii]|uniref:SWIM-type domain-containing protein n=1 Tax=Solanum commersonii TaxID=4109 RepID=A0A9J6A993_SOLCO|nr:hypothetical protein H5410_006210 [Solanum commersonii]
MNGFTLITLRWYHGGVLDLSGGEPIYNGGKVTGFLDVDVDKMSYFELKDYIRKLEYSTTCTFSIKAPNSGILVDVENDKDILDMTCSLENEDEVEMLVLLDLRNFSEEEVEGSDYSTEDSVESEAELAGDDDEEEYGSDVHKEARELRDEKRSFQMRKRRERVAADNEEVPVGEVGPDLGFDETETGKVSHKGRLGGDEPYFASSDEDSFKLDKDECCNDDKHKSGRSGRVLEENISRSMDCTIEFNGAVGFEVKEELCQHKVDIVRRTCSCRVWQLRGIPCAHVVAALYFKKFSLYDHIDSCYSKETYLMIYANVIEPLTNMEIWPVSTNPTIEPPEITSMPVYVMSEATTREGVLNVESSIRQSAPSRTASVRAKPTGSAGEEKTPSAPSEGEPPLKRGRGRPKKKSSVAPSAPLLPTTPTDFPASSYVPPTYHASSSIVGTTKRGRGRGRGNTSPKKRPRVMGMVVFQAANGFKVMNPGMPSSKIYSTGQAKVTRSSDVTGDIVYTSSNTTKLKWNDKAAISTSKLHELREKQRKKTMGSSSSQNHSSSQSKMP